MLLNEQKASFLSLVIHCIATVNCDPDGIFNSRSVSGSQGYVCTAEVCKPVLTVSSNLKKKVENAFCCTWETPVSLHRALPEADTPEASP